MSSEGREGGGVELNHKSRGREKRGEKYRRREVGTKIGRREERERFSLLQGLAKGISTKSLQKTWQSTQAPTMQSLHILLHQEASLILSVYTCCASLSAGLD